MFKKIFLAIAISCLAFAVNAEDVKPAAPSAAKFQPKNKMTDEDWAKLTKEQKIKILEIKRAERIKKSEDKWKKMSADEKIAQYEKRRKKAKEMRANRGKKKDTDINCAPAPAKAKQASGQPKPMPVKQ